MTSPIDILAGERGRIRVFAVNVSPDEMRERLEREPKSDVARALLRSPHLDTRSAEVFPVQDLDGVGLAQYLADGYAVPETSLGEDRLKLERLDGFVLLLFSDSFGGAADQLVPGTEVTLIGTYAETLPDHRQRPVTTPSAAPYSGISEKGTKPAHRGKADRALAYLTVASIAVLIAWWLLR